MVVQAAKMHFTKKRIILTRKTFKFGETPLSPEITHLISHEARMKNSTSDIENSAPASGMKNSTSGINESLRHSNDIHKNHEKVLKDTITNSIKIYQLC